MPIIAPKLIAMLMYERKADLANVSDIALNFSPELNSDIALSLSLFERN